MITTTNHRFLHAHHIEHWLNGGETSMENLCLLCSAHHRMVHEGGWGTHQLHGLPRHSSGPAIGG